MQSYVNILSKNIALEIQIVGHKLSLGIQLKKILLIIK